MASPDCPNIILITTDQQRYDGYVRAMKDAGFSTVTELDGGIQAWYSAGLPTVSP